MRARWLWLGTATLLAGCSLSTVKAGGVCQRSTQCQPGFGCVSGKCSKDLSSIAATNTVPMLGGSAGASGAAVGGSGGQPAAEGGNGAGAGGG